METNGQKTKEIDRHFDKDRSSLFETSLRIEKEAVEAEREYAKRYFTQALVILAVMVGYLTAFITTFDFAQLKQGIIDCLANKDTLHLVFINLSIIAAATGIIETIYGCYYGIKVLSSKNTPTLSPDKASDPLFEEDEEFNTESSALRRLSMCKEEHNRYLEQQVVNFQDIAQTEGASNDQRLKELHQCKSCGICGFILTLVAYIALSLLCA